MVLKYSIGVDASSKEIKVAVSTIDREQKVAIVASSSFSNSKSGFEKLQIWINKHCKIKGTPIAFCIEATGVYHEKCALFFHTAGFRVSVILPNKAKRYLQSLGLKSKNDSIDARGLSQMGAEQNLSIWQPMDGFFYQLRDYTRQNQALQEQRTIVNNQLHAESRGIYPSPFLIKQLKNHIAFIDNQVRALEKELVRHLNSNPEVSKKVENICKIKGLAVLSVCTVLAETNGFELFDNCKQVVSYAGYDVIENQSGNHFGKTRISKKGNSRIRRILHMPALTAKSKEPAMAALYQRTLAKHGIKMKSIVAVQKKLLQMIYFMFKKGMDYESYYRPNMQEKKEMSTSGSTLESKKIASNKSEATQGKHGAKSRSMFPLEGTKIKKAEKIVRI